VNELQKNANISQIETQKGLRKVKRGAGEREREGERERGSEREREGDVSTKSE
jgi:hypothetical protein